jgi:hypothetical protein
MTEPMQQPKPKFDSWAIVEVMGHTRVASKVTEESIAGVNMLRVDVPPVTKADRSWQNGAYVNIPYAVPGYTRYFGGASIFSITPCTEELAREAAGNSCSNPPIALALPGRVATEGDNPLAPSDEDDDDDDPGSHGGDDDDEPAISRAAGEGMVDHPRE